MYKAFDFEWTEESMYDSFGREKTDRMVLKLKRRHDLEDNYSWGEYGYYEAHGEYFEDEFGNIHVFEVYYGNTVEQGFDYAGIYAYEVY